MPKVSMIKPIKGLKNAHTSNSKRGMGDFYGSGVKNPTARSVENMASKSGAKKSLKTAPKSLA